MKRVLINGDRACLPIDGINRVLLEMTGSLDAIAGKDEYVLVVPSNVNEEFSDRIKEYKNIKIKKTILPYFRFWTFLFVDLAGLLLRRRVISFRNRNSVFGGGINMLQDIIPLRFYGSRDRKYLKGIGRLLYTSDSLIVASEFTRKDIEKAVKSGLINEGRRKRRKPKDLEQPRIQVIRLGWQHYLEIQEDPEIFNEYPCIKKGEYYFSLSGISPHKNLRFIYEAAERYPDRMFVVAGAMNRGYGYEHKPLKNLFFVGRISDPRAKALMMNCRAFIFPSLYEGAGLPPLEALSCNVPVMAADIEVIHEYCGDSVHYFDPYDHDTDFDAVLKTDVSAPEEALCKLSWDRAAQELKKIIESCRKEQAV
ncbi:MAG: glycosyltransferase family 4 protein [Lachnospiraceae bacterium]|nr:glycosyltransferase family 4 protein [Lachnospiraceae bacterium]